MKLLRDSILDRLEHRGYTIEELASIYNLRPESIKLQINRLIEDGQAIAQKGDFVFIPRKDGWFVAGVLTLALTVLIFVLGSW